MKRILIPVDFSDLSRVAISLADRLSRLHNSGITFLHAVPVSGEVLLDDGGNLIDSEEFDTKGLRDEMDKAHGEMDKLLKEYSQAGNPVVSYGSPEKIILQELSDNDYDLVVMATHGAAGIRGMISGTHTEHVAMKTDVPVLSVKSTNSRTDRIVIASSFAGEVILPGAVRSLVTEAGTSVVLLNIVTSDNASDRNDIETRMDHFAELNGISGFTKEFYISTDVEDGIEHFCSSHDTDLLVIESKGRTGVNRWLSGCVSADLVKHYDHAILTFKT